MSDSFESDRLAFVRFAYVGSYQRLCWIESYFLQRVSSTRQRRWSLEDLLSHRCERSNQDLWEKSRSLRHLVPTSYWPQRSRKIQSRSLRNFTIFWQTKGVNTLETFIYSKLSVQPFIWQIRLGRCWQIGLLIQKILYYSFLCRLFPWINWHVSSAPFMQCGTHRGIKIENKIFFVCFCLLFYSVLELGIEVVMVHHIHHIFVEVVFCLILKMSIFGMVLLY